MLKMKSVGVSVTKELLDKIDGERGLVSRSCWIREHYFRNPVNERPRTRVDESHKRSHR